MLIHSNVYLTVSARVAVPPTSNGHPQTPIIITGVCAVVVIMAIAAVIVVVGVVVYCRRHPTINPRKGLR